MLGLSPYATFKKARGPASRPSSTSRSRRPSPRRQQEREDILALLLSARYEDGEGMSREDLRSQLMTLLMAGHETTAIGLSWALYFLWRPARR